MSDRRRRRQRRQRVRRALGLPASASWREVKEARTQRGRPEVVWRDLPPPRHTAALSRDDLRELWLDRIRRFCWPDGGRPDNDRRNRLGTLMSALLRRCKGR